MKRKTTKVITTSLALLVLLSTSIRSIPAKAEESVKNNKYITSIKSVIPEVTKQNISNATVATKTLIAKEVDVVAIKKVNQDELVKQVEASQLGNVALDKSKQEEFSKLAQIAANKAKQEEINRIAVSVENVQEPNPATIEEDGITKEEADLAKIEADRLAQLEVDRLAEIEATRLAQLETARLETIRRNQTVIGAKLSKYLISEANVTSTLNRAVALHGGNTSNTCVYFSSEAMRRIGVPVPLATCNTGQYTNYLRAHAWVTSYNIKELTPGNICFTTNNWLGYPTHTFVFMGWVTEGEYTLAYVADNQGKSVHVRNMGATYATDAFVFFMHTPIAPAKIAASSSGYNSININWSAVAGASMYGIYRATSSAGPYTLISTPRVARYSNTGLTTNKIYYYKVRSYRIIGKVKLSSFLSDTIFSKPIPSTPTSVKGASSSYNSINTSWNTVTGATGYEVYRSAENEDLYTLISDTTAKSYNDTGLTTNSIYYYKIRAYRMAGTTKMGSDFSEPISSIPIPSSPTSVKGGSSSCNSINTSWNAVTGANGYEVFRSTSSNNSYALILNTTDTSFNDTGLTINTNYYYKIRAYMMVGTLKVYGNCSYVTNSKPVPSGATNVKAIRTSSKSIRLAWSAVEGANGYEIYKATSSSGTYSLLRGVSYTYYTNSSLTTGKTYYYKIRSYLTVGKTRVYGNWSEVVHAKA